MKTPSRIKYLLAILVFLGNVKFLKAQMAEIVNVSSYNCVNFSQEFTLINCEGCTDFQWTISGPHTTPHVAADGKSVDNFSWTSPGTYDLSCMYYNSGGDVNFAYSNSIVIQQNVTPEVTISRLPATNPITFGTNVTFTATPVGSTGGSSPAYQWFLNNVAQSGQTGVQYSNSTLQNGDQVFVRMYSSNACPPEGSDDSNLITVSVTYSIAQPTVSNAEGTYDASTTLSASGANTNAGEVYRWYEFSTGGSHLHEGLSYSTDVLLNHKTFYVSIWNPNAMAESARVPQTVTVVVPPPDAPAMSTNTCGPKTLTRGNPPASIVWYWQGTNATGQQVVNSALTYTVTEAAGQTYYLRAKAATANIWSTSVGVKVTTDPVDIEVDAYQSQNSVVQATHSVRLKPGFKVQPGNQFRGRIAISQTECNDIYNWSEEILYDQGGQPISRSRIYTTGLGQAMQSQTVDYLTGKVWASQPLYDKFNNAAAGTLPAPILENDFIYKKKFVINATTGQPYGADDFDAIATLNNPNAVGNQAGTAGWYYSSNNNLEPQTPVTSYPYSRSYTLEGPDPTTSTSASPGDQYKMGSGHEMKSERQLIGATDLDHYFSLRHYFVESSLPATEMGYKHITTDPDGKQAVIFVDADGRTLASATYLNGSYDNWSYSYYNDLGQLVATVAPKGVIIAPINPPPPYPQFVTLYQYDHLGRLIQTTSPDEGTSKFTYSTDGKIRFSENQEQRNASPKRFSYTNYDYLGRLIESGEYTSDVNLAGTNYVFQTHSESPATNSVISTDPNILDAKGFVYVSYLSQPTRCSDYTIIDYDEAMADCPGGATAQTNVAGQVSRTRNANATTWYSYDEFGQVIKTWQKLTNPVIADPEVTKTIDYTYDYYGNVTEVAYQKDNTSDRFYHHYVYDRNNRLLEVYTSKDGTARTLQAKYQYYLHGPLKRVVLGNNLQGIDYTYTIDGSLKAINHADPAKDPGGDGANDAFGETLHYYDGDYQGAGYSAGTQTISGYTNQFGGLIKGMSWHSPADNHNKQLYAYQYNDRNFLTNAVWGNMTGSAGSYSFSPSSNESHREAAGNYDKNGNIGTMFRKGKSGNEIANYAYIYESNTNRLDKVNNSSSVMVDYAYNAIGQMTQQTEGPSKTFNITYNAYGLVKEIRDYNNVLVQSYYYDDRGNILQKVLHNSNSALQKYTTYISDLGGNVLAIYEQTGTTTLALQPLEVPVYGAGRVAVYKPAANRYFYEVSDHLGNVRAVIGAPQTVTATATMETANQSTEQNQFLRYQNVRIVNAAIFDHTNAAGSQNAIRLSGSANEKTGLARSFSVSPGDVVKLEVYAKYVDPNSANVTTALNNLVNSIVNGTAAPGTVIDGAAYSTNSSNPSPYAGMLTPPSSSGPKAYLNYLFFDRNFAFQLSKSGLVAVTEAAKETGTDIAHEKLFAQLNITEPGFIYAYLSNDNPTPIEVYFDDFSITHEQSAVVAGADYMPFGLPMENREISDEPYRYGYQGQFSEKDLTTGQQEFDLRNYDARFGRWSSPDPYEQYASPYMAMGNVPHFFTDATGGWSGCPPVCPEEVIAATTEGGSIGTAIYGGIFKPVEIPGTRIGSIAGKLPKIVSATVSAIPNGVMFQGTDKSWYAAYPTNEGSYIYKYENGEWQMHINEPQLRQNDWNNLLRAHEVINNLNANMVMTAIGMFSFSTGLRQAMPGAIGNGVKPTLQVAETGGQFFDDAVAVFHKGELSGGVVSSTRALSTGLDEASVAALQRAGKVWKFKIPRHVLQRWKFDGLVDTFVDTDAATGVINTEIRFSPKLASQMQKYLIIH
ncbi:hypothetical protein KK083_09635 [Fulvivirgaceae bacterium PWU4]|uniref:Ig-like domain-containing protein n=1 Tax=Chryseosolibacter histidini TaxID=2782349 RepID=A0AAP2DIW3_9BACT|nr:RHS repeat-associated core domain-containing protein [Chryseosolibacter histidini]MBT1697136.1 hypothetical protein [Chryseosolibacter histidini]